MKSHGGHGQAVADMEQTEARAETKAETSPTEVAAGAEAEEKGSEAAPNAQEVQDAPVAAAAPPRQEKEAAGKESPAEVQSP